MRKLSKSFGGFFFATADALDMVDYFGATEKPAQLQKTSDEEFLPGEYELKESFFFFLL